MTDENTQATLTWRVTPNLLSIVDREGRFVAVNPAWRETLGWERAEMVGAPFLSFLHPDDIARTRRAFAQLLSGKPVLRFENRYRTRAGDHRWLEWVSVPEGGRFYCTARRRHRRQGPGGPDRAAAGRGGTARAVHGRAQPRPAQSPRRHRSGNLRAAAPDRGRECGGDPAPDQEQRRTHVRDLIDNLMDLTRVRLGDGLGIERHPCRQPAGGSGAGDRGDQAGLAAGQNRSAPGYRRGGRLRTAPAFTSSSPTCSPTP